MTANKKLTIGIIALLIANIVLVTLLLTGQKSKKNSKRNQSDGPAQIIIKKLNFNDEQIASFKELIKVHKQEIRDNDDQIREVKKQIFTSLGSEATVNIDSLSTVIAGLQKDIEIKHYNHFLKIKALCHEDQVDKFNELSKMFVKIFSANRHSSQRKK